MESEEHNINDKHRCTKFVKGKPFYTIATCFSFTKINFAESRQWAINKG